ncbi:Hypothetical protein FKW44_019733 [Caligus rogercresseyi]|uniref:Uncharacterized protein n=1 Tax=Caligus rogercresseyi TaxID=217165 RepID=A0A7T8GWV9_CALRO|nr:Hypothetical protein FKW44_019733 [Caligus rogercresseyi]
MIAMSPLGCESGVVDEVGDEDLRHMTQNKKSTLGVRAVVIFVRQEDPNPLFLPHIAMRDLKRSSSHGGNRLLSNLPYDLSRFDPKLRNLSMKVPTVALPPDEYRRRRGFKWLPPMKDKPELDASSAEDDSRYGSRNASNRVYGMPKRTTRES